MTRRREMPRVFAPLPRSAWHASGVNLAPLFTPKQWNILDGVVCGLNNYQIAREMHTTHNTIRNYLRAIFDIAGVDSRLELALFWLEHGYGRCKYPVKNSAH
jgi:DNA-binding NarL/FixJ family response regulator